MLLRTLALLLLALSSGMSATLRNYKSQEDLSEEAPVLDNVAAEAHRQQETVLDDVPVAEALVADEQAAEAEVPAAAVPDAPLPATEDIIVEEPALEPDTAGDPAVEEPIAGEPDVDTPVSEEAVHEEAVPEVPVGESAAVEEPVDARPVAEAPEANEPVPDMDTMSNAAALEDLAEEALGHETPAEETPTEEAPTGEVPDEDAPAVDAPAEDAPAEDTPAEDAPAEDEPAEDAPAEDGPAEDAPAEDAPAEVEGNDIEALPEILSRPPKLEDSAWGLNSIRDSFQAVNGYFDSLVELVGGRNGVCQYRCKYDKAPVHRPGYQIPEPNGCSSSFLGFQVADAYFDMGVPAMTKCCDQLDICYDTCGTNKYRCDSKFRWCVHSICADLKKSLGFVSKVQACEAVADTLYNTLWTLGCRPYLTSQRAACFCEGEEKDEL